MRFKDIFLACMIIFIFIAVFLVSFFIAGYKNIQNNWPQYACSPMIMPFASQFGHDTGENFTQCLGNLQGGIMGVFTTPMHFITGTLMTSISNLTQNISSLRNLQGFMRGSMGSFTGDIFGIMQNVLIQFQKMITSMKDIMAKLLGIVATFLYMISGAQLVGASIINGPILTIIDILSLGIACFHPNTPLQLKNNKYVAMKDIHLGDVLINGSKVIGTLQLQGGKRNPYYKIYSNQLKQFIYVTGEHKIRDRSKNQFIPVRTVKYSIPTDLYDEVLSCIITDDHLIPVGEHIFWDWED